MQKALIFMVYVVFALSLATATFAMIDLSKALNDIMNGSPITGMAVGDECYADEDCDLDQICVYGSCEEGCYSDNDCSIEKICDQGQCTAIDNTGCEYDADCELDYICDYDECVAGCYSDADCNTGKTCAGGYCTMGGGTGCGSITSAGVCENNVLKWCNSNGELQTLDCSTNNLVCRYNVVSEVNDCLPEETASYSSHGQFCDNALYRCESGLVCKGTVGTCCYENENIVNGHCTTGQTDNYCDYDADCELDYICDYDECVAGCYSDADCNTGKTCTGGQCLQSTGSSTVGYMEECNGANILCEAGYECKQDSKQTNKKYCCHSSDIPEDGICISNECQSRGVGSANKCEGNKLLYCLVGKVEELDCSQLQRICGINPDTGVYDCIPSTGPGSPGVPSICSASNKCSRGNGPCSGSDGCQAGLACVFDFAGNGNGVCCNANEKVSNGQCTVTGYLAHNQADCKWSGLITLWGMLDSGDSCYDSDPATGKMLECTDDPDSLTEYCCYMDETVFNDPSRGTTGCGPGLNYNEGDCDAGLFDFTGYICALSGYNDAASSGNDYNGKGAGKDYSSKGTLACKTNANAPIDICCSASEVLVYDTTKTGWRCSGATEAAVISATSTQGTTGQAQTSNRIQIDELPGLTPAQKQKCKEYCGDAIYDGPVAMCGSFGDKVHATGSRDECQEYRTMNGNTICFDCTNICNNIDMAHKDSICDGPVNVCNLLQTTGLLSAGSSFLPFYSDKYSVRDCVNNKGNSEFNFLDPCEQWKNDPVCDDTQQNCQNAQPITANGKTFTPKYYPQYSVWSCHEASGGQPDYKTDPAKRATWNQLVQQNQIPASGTGSQSPIYNWLMNGGLQTLGIG